MHVPAVAQSKPGPFALWQRSIRMPRAKEAAVWVRSFRYKVIRSRPFVISMKGGGAAP